MAIVIYRQPHTIRDGLAIYDVEYERRDFELRYNPITREWGGVEFVFDDEEDDMEEHPLLADEAKTIAKLVKLAVPQARLEAAVMGKN